MVIAKVVSPGVSHSNFPSNPTSSISMVVLGMSGTKGTGGIHNCEGSDAKTHAILEKLGALRGDAACERSESGEGQQSLPTGSEHLHPHGFLGRANRKGGPEPDKTRACHRFEANDTCGRRATMRVSSAHLGSLAQSLPPDLELE